MVSEAGQIDHDLDNLDPNLPSWDVAQDLFSTDPTQDNLSQMMQIIQLPMSNMS